MTAIERAIKEAVEKGEYEPDIRHIKETGQKVILTDEKTALLDALFWQALGRARGWENHQRPYWSSVLLKEYDSHIEHGGISGKRLHPWHAQMHRFIDHLAEGKDAESFFADL